MTIGPLDDGFDVEDDGPGIPDEESGEVFASGYSTSSAGTGPGLAIVDRIVEAHGWDSEVTDADASGARFEITGVEFESPETPIDEFTDAAGD